MIPSASHSLTKPECNCGMMIHKGKEETCKDQPEPAPPRSPSGAPCSPLPDSTQSPSLLNPQPYPYRELGSTVIPEGLVLCVWCPLSGQAFRTGSHSFPAPHKPPQAHHVYEPYFPHLSHPHTQKCHSCVTGLREDIDEKFGESPRIVPGTHQAPKKCSVLPFSFLLPSKGKSLQGVSDHLWPCGWLMAELGQARVTSGSFSAIWTDWHPPSTAISKPPPLPLSGMKPMLRSAWTWGCPWSLLCCTLHG